MDKMSVAAFLLVMVMITNGESSSPSPLASTFCVGKNESSYCQDCLQPVYCDGQGGIIEYGRCPTGEACAVSLGASYCTTQNETPCPCIANTTRCDAYDPHLMVQCSPSGALMMGHCSDGQLCYYGRCRVAPECVPDEWIILKPYCTSAVFCNVNGSIIDSISCSDGEYMNSEIECSSAPPTACDGSCTGRCPDPIDCSKFVVCDGTTEIGSGDCPAGTFFDTEINNCASSDENCIATDGCDFRVITTTTSMTTSDPGTAMTTNPVHGPDDIIDE